MKVKAWIAALSCAIVVLTGVIIYLLIPGEESQGKISAERQAALENADIIVRPENQIREISPYLFGINGGVDLDKVTAGSFRIGGNRLTAYNWENNVSNAGSDWYNHADLYLMESVSEKYQNVPAGTILDSMEAVNDHNIPYSLLTLQMLGYVSSDIQDYVPDGGKAPSKYWYKVQNRKDGELSLEPDLEDDVVYMDEYLNYLFSKIGNSESETGFRGYALDNEPALWNSTHSLAQPKKISCRSLMEKSIDLASLVKEMDPGAEVFGPALYGYYAFLCLQDAPDWITYRNQGNYRWFIDFYLDEMSKAEEEYGYRLLDVLDLHYYTEARGTCGERFCSHYDNDECVKARLDSVRSLYDAEYEEDSWITDTGAEFFPLLYNVQQSIDTYYPGTKIAFTEYNLGGGDHISGGVAEADLLGIFAKYGVYFSTLWSFDENEYQLSAINLYTNYDGMGSSFGDMLVEGEWKDQENMSVYCAVDSETPDVVRIMVIHKKLHEETQIHIMLDAEETYKSVQVYGMYGDSSKIRQLESVEEITENGFTYTLQPLSVTEFVVSK